MPIKKFTKEFMLGVLCDDNEDAEIVENEIAETSRWSICYDFTFKFEGKYWSTGYSVGATEYQPETPWEYDEEITCMEVEPVEKTVIVYREVKNND